MRRGSKHCHRTAASRRPTSPVVPWRSLDIVRDPSEHEIRHLKVVPVLHHHVGVTLHPHIGKPNDGSLASPLLGDALHDRLSSFVARTTGKDGRVQVIAE